MTLIDRQALDQTRHEDPELVADLLDIFCRQWPALRQRFDAAVESCQPAEVLECAHLMKSRLRYLHCYQLGDLAAEIEGLASNDCLTGINTRYAALKSGTAEAIEELHGYVREFTS